MERPIERNSCGCGEVETALLLRLGDADYARRVTRQKCFRQAMAFVAEDQPVTVGKICREERVLRFAGKKPEAVVADRGKKGAFVIVQGELEPRPVVHGAALERLVAQHKPERTDEVKLGS